MIGYVIAMCLLTTVASAQVLTTLTIVARPTAVVISPNKKLVVLNDPGASHGQTIRNVNTWESVKRLGVVGRDVGVGTMECFGFLNDSITVFRGSPGILRFHDARTGDIIDSVQDVEFCTWMSEREICFMQRVADSMQLYAYDYQQGQSRYLTTIPSAARVFSSHVSPCIIVWESGKGLQIIDKTNGQHRFSYPCSESMRFNSPLSITSEGDAFFTIDRDSSFVRVSLTDGNVDVITKVSIEDGETLALYANNTGSNVALIRYDESDMTTLDLLTPGGGIRRLKEAKGSDHFTSLTWSPDGVRYFLSSTHFIWEYSISDPMHRRLLAIRRVYPRVYTVCQERVVVLSSNDASPIRLFLDDMTAESIDITETGNYGAIAIVGRLAGSDSLMTTTNTANNYIGVCDREIQWTTLADSVHSSLLGISSDRQYTLGVDYGRMLAIITNLANNQQSTIDVAKVGTPLKIEMATKPERGIVIGNKGTMAIACAQLSFDVNSSIVGYASEISKTSSMFDDAMSVCLAKNNTKRLSLYKAYPEGLTELSLSSEANGNEFVHAGVYDDGKAVILIEEGGRVSRLDLSTMAETHVMQLDGFAATKGFPDRSSATYDVRSGVLATLNWYGELLIQRWPSTTSTVPDIDNTLSRDVRIEITNGIIRVYNNTEDDIRFAAIYDLLGRAASTPISISAGSYGDIPINSHASSAPMFLTCVMDSYTVSRVLSVR